ncbi:replication initiator protein A [Novosphingobium sp. AP12]|uniref:replication initiator protein A n=1 Tax=Novosphingobium sp. AP12 TaxID=1144305 RepID=UPI001EE66333|nr:replication initiator protein A [Novosphingobium sp. AP12]
MAGSNHSSRIYTRLADVLESLQGTQIRTNIEAGGRGRKACLVAVRGGAAICAQRHEARRG